MTARPIISCVPVSWPTGLGELMRMVTLTKYALGQGLDARFHFFVNGEIPLRAQELIPASAEVTRLTSSPTVDTGAVLAAHRRLRPDLVLFDNAGSGRQCRHAKRLGARTVFLSTRRETRLRGLRLDWLPWLDEHWIVGPRRLSGELSTWLKLKTRLAAGPVYRRFESIFSPRDADRAARLLATLDLTGRRYGCFLPGGGGGVIAGRSAVEIFADAAQRFSRQIAAPAVLLQGPLAESEVRRQGVIDYRATHEEAVDLVAGAHLVVVGASSSLFMALALGKICVATTSCGAEQLPRARAWDRRGYVLAARPEAGALAAAAGALWDDAGPRRTLGRRAASLRVVNDMPRVYAAMVSLLGKEG